MAYAVRKKRSASRKVEEAGQIIAQLEKEIENHLKSEEEKNDLQSRIESQKRELGKIIEYRTRGVIKRAKVRWFNEGEKNTRYFLNLEKRYCKQQTITQLKTSDNSTFVTSDKEIINVCEHFYKDLYSSNSNIFEEPDFFFPHENPKTLDSDQQSLCEGKLTKAECLEALKSMDSDKSPGSDGFPADFIKSSGTAFQIFF